MRFDRMELAGSLGDLGTLLPIAVAMILVNGLDPTGLFLVVGLLYVLAGLYFGVPVAVQPMKVVGAYAVATAAGAGQVGASGLLLGAVLLVLGVTGLVDRAARYVPRAVVRGVQLSTGLLLLAKGVGFMAGTSGFQQARGAAEPFLTVHGVGPVPIHWLLGAAAALAALFFLNSRRFPAAILVVGGGLVLGLALGGWPQGLSPGLHLPRFFPGGWFTGADLTYALFAFVLPQLPMTMGNAVIANRDLSHEYFGEQGRRVTDRSLCVSMGLANLAAAVVGGMPVCHGAGGLAAHYRFGARTGGSNLIIGAAFILLALVLGPGVLGVVQLLPLSVLGVLLVFAAAQLGLTIIDLTDRPGLFVAVVMAGVALASNLAWGFGVGLVLAWLFRTGRASV